MSLLLATHCLTSLLFVFVILFIANGSALEKNDAVWRNANVSDNIQIMQYSS